MTSSTVLKKIFATGRPLVEQWLDVADQIASLREVATAQGFDWSQVKALLKAQVQDERDERGDGKRVKRIIEKAEFASAYAGMLGLGGNMNEKNFSVSGLEHDPITGEIPPDATPITGDGGPLTDETSEPVASGASQEDALSTGNSDDPAHQSPDPTVPALPADPVGTGAVPQQGEGAAPDPFPDIPPFLSRGAAAQAAEAA